jgi:hypothetical protein
MYSTEHDYDALHAVAFDRALVRVHDITQQRRGIKRAQPANGYRRRNGLLIWQ